MTLTHPSPDRLFDPPAGEVAAALADLHPAVRTWFERRFPEGPSAPQVGAWPAIRAGEDVLVAAPTGSGKTLAAFLVCIDRLYRAHDAGEELEGHTRVVYVSPLKALAVDIGQNLETPLAEIAAIARELGMEPAPIDVGVRSGDTTSSARAAMVRRPPSILVTTPESLYLLVTADRSRKTLTEVTTVIVDEIHAVARDKRGSHLALTLERLDHVCERRPARIGLSATQRPIETIARLLVGAGPERSEADGRPRCTIVDVGHRRVMDIAIELPDSDLEAVASNEQLAEVLDRIAEHVTHHRTTLVFVNTRRLAERLAHLLAERLGDDRVAAHHGSLSKDRRLRVETRLRAGDLRALVATASLELGIDIGPVELVCQIGSPRAIATFLQRVGRSGHQRHGLPKGRLYPLSRDELVECSGLLAAVRAGRLDVVRPPEQPLDVLAQQLVAETAAEDISEDDLYALVRGAAPYASLSRQDFDDTVELASEGITTGRGRRGAYLHRDRVAGDLRARRGARLAALTSGGAIPETADYRVLADPDDTPVGTVNEDWAIESMAGDVFLLGTHSWRIRRIESGIVRVTDAQGAPPTVPFWFGEAPARTFELSAEVSAVRTAIDAFLAADQADEARAWLQETCGIDGVAAAQVVRYLATGRAVLGVLPSQTDIVIERFFDETGGMQLVVHAPFGGRVNRGLGLALRKRFCKTFDFELQAAADDDAIVLSLGPQHSFPLEDVPRFLHPDTVESVLAQAALLSPMFTARWRWNLNRSLVVLRNRAGKRNPPPIQRMESDDLLAAVFPGLAACQENAGGGPIEIPDHVLVRQTMYDCLHEAMDVDGLRELVAAWRDGRVRVHTVDTTEPSVLAHEILNGKPYTFLDDAPLEERRTRAVPLRRGLPVSLDEIGRVDFDAIERVRDEARPDPRDADELHDLLVSLVLLAPEPAWEADFDLLVGAGRAGRVATPAGPRWAAVERRPFVAALLPDAVVTPDHPVPAALAGLDPEAEQAAAECCRGHLDVTGPITVDDLAARTALPAGLVTAGLLRLEGEGFALRGRWSAPGTDGDRTDAGTGEVAVEWCARRLLVRIHRGTQRRLRAEIEPVTAQDFMRFLLRWQHASPDTRVRGRRGLSNVLEQLQGFELAAGAWEESVLPARVDAFDPRLVDELCLSGELAWARLSVKAEDLDAPARRAGATPSRATPVSFVLRSDLPWLLRAARGDVRPATPGPGAAAEVLEALAARGALFPSELADATNRLPAEIEDALWDGVARGLVTADGFHAVRALFRARERWTRRQRPVRRGLRRGASGRVAGEGRWALVPEPGVVDDPDELAEAIAEQLLARWGVVFRDLLVRENLAVAWRDVLWALRRLEARGLVRGGRFVTGFTGEQYALPEALEALRATRRAERDGTTVSISAADPLNLVGIVVPGPRVPALRGNRVVYRDGLPVETEGGATDGDDTEVVATA